MDLFGMTIEIKNLPPLDPEFIPFGLFIDNYLKTAKKPIAIAIFRNDDLVSVYHTLIHGTPDKSAADRYYVERIVKFLLWQKGGFEIAIYDDERLAKRIIKAYRTGGLRGFDVEFMSNIYEREFITRFGYGMPPDETERPTRLGGQTNGCRIGFDASGSDRRVSAVIEGEAIYSEEVVWNPKTNSDPSYHFDNIVSALSTAASKMPRVDAIGISSAGIYFNNRTAAASLFLNVPHEDFNEHIKDIYIRAAAVIGDVPLVVANDGDIAAITGAIGLNDTKVLGIALGTSEAAGYIDGDGNITGWLNELAFAPVDCNPNAMADEWSGDIGCGVKYFSQDAVIKLAAIAGIKLDENASPAERLKEVHILMARGDDRARRIFVSIGVYLGHTLPLYAKFYDIKHVLLLGRVVSGNCGVIIVDVAKRVLADEYPDLNFEIHLPDENSRRVGQSVAAASLPIVPLSSSF
jgi:predicted NBD/HSP70 family sugar kinase